MDLVHRFTVPVPVEQAWADFNDIASIAECFPGATVTSADDQGFAGSVKVKLGPIALVYNGSGSFVEKDAATRRMQIDAKGKDKRGNGTAAAQVLLTMTGAGAGAVTEVEVTTHLSITGKPAQFGRGVMQDVSDKLLGQFVDCLEQRYSTGPVAQTAAETRAVPDPGTARPATESATGPATGPATAPAADPATESAILPESLDLGRTVLPVLARTYGPWVVAGIAVLAALRWWRRR